LVELVKIDTCFNQGFKDPQMKKVANVVLDLTGIPVSTLQIYNHIRKWRKCGASLGG
jgi:hypothetical protein